MGDMFKDPDTKTGVYFAHEVCLELSARRLAAWQKYDEQGCFADRKYVNQDLERMVHELDRADRNEAKKAAGKKTKDGGKKDTPKGGKGGKGGKGSKTPATGGKKGKTNKGDDNEQDNTGEKEPEEGKKGEKEVQQLGELPECHNTMDIIDPDPNEGVFIVVDEQAYRRLYWKDSLDDEEIDHFVVEEEVTLPRDDIGIRRETLMKYSREAFDYFSQAFDPTTGLAETRLHLPIKRPREHELGRRGYFYRYDSETAFVSPMPIEEYIIPWLRQMEELPKSSEHPQEIPQIEIPDTILGKIHLYNAMLQLGILRFFQRPLIEQLCIEIHSTRLSECELDVLEMTIGRFNARGVSVLDPVLSCFTGSFAGRKRSDKSFGIRRNSSQPRGCLEYSTVEIQRQAPESTTVFDDTIIDPPMLPVLGHCVQNWSGQNRFGRHPLARLNLGYPLHIGESAYYKRVRKDNRPSNPPRRRGPEQHLEGTLESPDSLGVAPGPRGPEQPAEGSRDEPDSLDSGQSTELKEHEKYDVLRRTARLKNRPGIARPYWAVIKQ